MAVKHVVCRNEFLPPINVVYSNGQLCIVAFTLSIAKTDYERFIGAGNVPWVYEYDCHLFHSKSNGAD